MDIEFRRLTARGRGRVRGEGEGWRCKWGGGGGQWSSVGLPIQSCSRRFTSSRDCADKAEAWPEVTRYLTAVVLRIRSDSVVS